MNNKTKYKDKIEKRRKFRMKQKKIETFTLTIFTFSKK